MTARKLLAHIWATALLAGLVAAVSWSQVRNVFSVVRGQSRPGALIHSVDTVTAVCLAVLTAIQLLYTLWVVLSMCLSCCSGNRPSSGAHRGYVPLSGGSGPRGV